MFCFFNGQVPVPTSGLMDYALSLRPEYHQAILDVIAYYGWKNIIYIYDSHDGKLIFLFYFALLPNGDEKQSVKTSSSQPCLPFRREREQLIIYLQAFLLFQSIRRKNEREFEMGPRKKGQHLTSFSTNLRFPPFPFLCNTSSGFRLSVYIDVTKQTVSTKTSSVNFLFFYY